MSIGESFLFNGWNSCPVPCQCWAPDWFELMHTLCLLLYSMQVHMCTTTVVSRRHCFLGIIFPSPFPHGYLSPERVGVYEDIPFRTECSKISHSAYFLVLGSVLALIYCKNNYSWTELVVILLLFYYLFIITKFFCIWFLPMPMAYQILGSSLPKQFKA